MKYTQYMIWSEKYFFFHFCENFYYQNFAKSLLRAQILISAVCIVYPGKIGNFIYPMAYKSPKNSNSNYRKIAFFSSKEL